MLREYTKTFSQMNQNVQKYISVNVAIQCHKLINQNFVLGRLITVNVSYKYEEQFDELKEDLKMC